MHGPTCIFWANLTPFSLEGRRAIGRKITEQNELFRTMLQKAKAAVAENERKLSAQAAADVQARSRRRRINFARRPVYFRGVIYRK